LAHRQEMFWQAEGTPTRAGDAWYTKHQSFWLDLKIVFITIFKILKAEGISGQGVVTAVKFNGSN
jgi:lipopolysaccharide/colanic/teichoic acid biosynthesis glycosyltransferase